MHLVCVSELASKRVGQLLFEFLEEVNIAKSVLLSKLLLTTVNKNKEKKSQLRPRYIYRKFQFQISSHSKK